MLDAAIALTAFYLPKSREGSPVTRLPDALIARPNDWGVWIIGEPHQWALNILTFVGDDAFAALVAGSENPSIYGRFAVVVSLKADGTPKLIKYGASARCAAKWSARKVRKIRIDVSEAEKLHSAHGRKAARVSNDEYTSFGA